VSALGELVSDLIADVRLYAASEGGKTNEIRKGYRCPCAATNVSPAMMHSAELLIGEEPLNPGELRRVGFVFVTSEGAAAMRRAGTFYIWDGGFIGEAAVVE